MPKQEPVAADETAPLDPMIQLLRSLHAVMKAVDTVHKSGENTFHDYRYATEGDLLEKLRPAMIENGLILIPSVGQVAAIDPHGNTTVTVSYTLAHVNGAIWPEKIIAAGCGGDKSKKGIGDKGLYKALTGANKYLLLKLFQIATNDEEEAEHPKGDEDRDTISEDQAARTFYLEAALIAVSRQETTKELREWWDDEYDNRKRAGVVKGTAEYSDLYAKLLRRGDELKKKEER